MNKRIVKAAVISIITIGVLMFAGCRKCYDCDVLYGSFVCYKGTDTIHYVGTRNEIHDSLAAFYTSGYDCDTIIYMYLPDAYSICGKNAKENLEATGYKCRKQ